MWFVCFFPVDQGPIYVLEPGIYQVAFYTLDPDSGFGRFRVFRSGSFRTFGSMCVIGVNQLSENKNHSDHILLVTSTCFRKVGVWWFWFSETFESIDTCQFCPDPPDLLDEYEEVDVSVPDRIDVHRRHPTFAKPKSSHAHSGLNLHLVLESLDLMSLVFGNIRVDRCTSMSNINHVRIL